MATWCIHLGIFFLSLLSFITTSPFPTQPYPTSLYGAFSYTPPYQAARSYSKDKYYSKKAPDLNQLRNSIYGIGNGLYGFRYGGYLPSSRPYFPPYIGLPDPYFNFPAYGRQPFLPGSIGQYPPNYFGVPKKYNGFYSQNVAYGKGYNYGSKSVYQQSSIQPGFGTVANNGWNSKGYPYAPGYQYSYFFNYPTVSKIIPSPILIGYNPIYGVRYNFPQVVQPVVQPQYGYQKVIPSPAVSGYDSIYGINYNKGNLPPLNPAQPWINNSKIATNPAFPNPVYNGKYFQPQSKLQVPIPAPKWINNPNKGISSNIGSKFNYIPSKTPPTAFWSNGQQPGVLPDPGPYSLLPPWVNPPIATAGATANSYRSPLFPMSSDASTKSGPLLSPTTDIKNSGLYNFFQPVKNSANMDPLSSPSKDISSVGLIPPSNKGFDNSGSFSLIPPIKGLVPDPGLSSGTADIGLKDMSSPVMFDDDKRSEPSDVSVVEKSPGLEGFGSRIRDANMDMKIDDASTNEKMDDNHKKP